MSLCSSFTVYLGQQKGITILLVKLAEFNPPHFSLFFCNDPIHLTSSHYGSVYAVSLFHCFVTAPLAFLWCVLVEAV